MPRHLVLDRTTGKIAYQTTPAEVNRSIWPVDFTVASCDQTARYVWTVDGVPKPFTRTGCEFRLAFPKEGPTPYSVEVMATPLIGGPSGVASLSVTVRDWLIVGLGDSLSSGEGVPDIFKHNRASAQWEDTRCHRSAKSYQALAARDIERADPHASVTFVHLACSGATISKGILGAYAGIEPADTLHPLLPQLEALRKLKGDRPIDALLLSIGVNDLNFGPVTQFCATWSNCENRPWRNFLRIPFAGTRLHTLVTRWLQELCGPLPIAKSCLPSSDYARLNRALLGVVPANRVYIMQYDDPLHNADGKTFCGTILDHKDTAGGRHLGLPKVVRRLVSRFVGISQPNAEWLYEHFLVPLNQAVKAAATEYHWNLISGPQDFFANHGYCTNNQRSWIRNIGDSVRLQGNIKGTLHPNAAGHEFLTSLLLPKLSLGLQALSLGL